MYLEQICPFRSEEFKKNFLPGKFPPQTEQTAENKTFLSVVLNALIQGWSQVPCSKFIKNVYKK